MIWKEFWPGALTINNANKRTASLIGADDWTSVEWVSTAWLTYLHLQIHKYEHNLRAQLQIFKCEIITDPGTET